MSTEIKPIMITVLVWIIILSALAIKFERKLNQDSNVTSNDVIVEDIKDEQNEVDSETSEIIENPTNENEEGNNLQEQTPVEDSTENTKTETTTDYKDCKVPSNNSIKSYMDYRCITSPKSRQYQLQQSLAYTGDYGIRMVGERYCVAVGSYYTTTIGQYIDIELANGEVIQGILADCKANAHTDDSNRINPNGSVIEFVVDTKVLDETARIMGDISYVNNWDSKVVNIKVYEFIEKF